tara:strand:- start:143 stop:412 length:270 start_codon:yes stop_codon:yes gene_type:complete
MLLTLAASRPYPNSLLVLAIIPYAYFTTPVAILRLKGIGFTLLMSFWQIELTVWNSLNASILEVEAGRHRYLSLVHVSELADGISYIIL